MAGQLKRTTNKVSIDNFNCEDIQFIENAVFVKALC